MHKKKQIWQDFHARFFLRNPDYLGSVFSTYMAKEGKNKEKYITVVVEFRTLFSDKKSVAQIAKDAGESRLRVTQDKDEIPIHSKPVFKFSSEALINCL